MCLYDPGTCHRAGPQWMLSELTDRERERGGLPFRGGIKLTLASSHLCQMRRDSGPVLLSVAVCLLLGQRWMTHGTRSATWPPARPASPAGQLCTLPLSACPSVCSRHPCPVGLSQWVRRDCLLSCPQCALYWRVSVSRARILCEGATCFITFAIQVTQFPEKPSVLCRIYVSIRKTRNCLFREKGSF